MTRAAGDGGAEDGGGQQLAPDMAEIVSEWIRKTEEHARCTLMQVGPCVWCKDHDVRLWQGTLPGAVEDYGPDHYDPDDDPNAPRPDDDDLSLGTCPECGQVGPCSYDAEGRALIHVTTEDEDA